MMRLETDYIHPTPSGGRCRIRIFLPDDPERDQPVVICTRSRGSVETTPIMDTAERIAGEVLAHFDLPVPVVWVEHHERGPRGTPEDPHTFDLLHFDSYRWSNDQPGERLIVQGITYRPIDRAAVESLLGKPLD